MDNNLFPLKVSIFFFITAQILLSGSGLWLGNDCLVERELEKLLFGFVFMVMGYCRCGSQKMWVGQGLGRGSILYQDS